MTQPQQYYAPVTFPMIQDYQLHGAPVTTTAVPVTTLNKKAAKETPADGSKPKASNSEENAAWQKYMIDGALYDEFSKHRQMLHDQDPATRHAKKDKKHKKDKKAKTKTVEDPHHVVPQEPV